VSEMIHKGEVDFALQFSLVAERGVDIMASFPAPVRMVMRPDHPLAAKDVQLIDLHPYPLAMNEQGSTIRQLFDLSCRMSGVFLEPAVSCNRFSVLYDFMVHTPGAIAACSHFSIMYKARRDNLRVKPVNIEQLNQRTLQLQSPAGKRRSAALTQFIEFVRGEIARESEAFIRDFGL